MQFGCLHNRQMNIKLTIPKSLKNIFNLAIKTVSTLNKVGYYKIQAVIKAEIFKKR